MIIGNGMLAQALKPIDDDQNILYFASGISNSLENDKSQFNRELKLLKEYINLFPKKKLVYFSTCSIYDASKKDSPYVLHKLFVESVITNQVPNYAIIRVGNAVGKGGNPNTLVNFLKDSILSEATIEIHRNARRILIDVNDIAKFLKNNLEHITNETINLSYPYQYSLKEIIENLEICLNKKAIYKLVKKGSVYEISFDETVINFFKKYKPQMYITSLLKNYV